MRIKLPRYTTAGDDLGSRQPLLFIHGFPLSRALWEQQVNDLSDSARALAFDLRGFGQAEAVPGPATLDDYSDDCLAFLDAVRAEQPAVLCGLSMGGYIALAFYRRHPARVAGLILAASRAGADSPEGRAGRDRLAQTARAHGAAAVAEAMLPRLFAPATYTTNPALIESTRAMLAGASVDGIVSALAALRDRPDATPALAGIAVPTLVIHGAEDQLIPPAEAEKTAAGIPGAALRIMPGAGHLPNLEQPAIFNAAVRDFMLSF